MVRPVYIVFARVASCIGVIFDLSGSEGSSYPFRQWDVEQLVNFYVLCGLSLARLSAHVRYVVGHFH